ncbi:MAG: DUF2093 domain-containing protein [Pseudomonadota bacterium]|jgi:hypothetical protein|nr:DUF2093 domain-containing protein [Pseudomonadota bacterium]
MLMSADNPAVLHFEANGFRVVRPGAFVLCAVSGERIPLDALRYWSASLQEAYASPEIATRRLMGKA